MPGDPLEKEALERLQMARQEKARVQEDLAEGLFFTEPRLSRQVTSTTATPKDAPDQSDADELATTLGTEVSGDFASHVLATFMPSTIDWARRRRGMFMTTERWEEIEEAVGEADKQILETIRSSNIEAAAYQAFDPNLSIGTAALWIDVPRPADPVAVRSIPMRELEINIGATGEIDDRFWVKWTAARYVKGMLGETVWKEVPDKLRADLEKNPKTTHSVTWGYWRDLQNLGSFIWRHVILVDKTLVYAEDLTGEGACAIIVPRFFPAPSYAWGNGPVLKALPYLRVVDALSAATQDRADIAVNPPFGYPNDGVINFEGGIKAGHAYPMAPGSGRDVASLYFEGDPNIGFFTLADLERSVKRLAYVDEPQQLGKTPPSATQFLDEVVRAQRRIGPPGQKFWSEGPRAIFVRFEYLLRQAGVIEDLGAEASLEAFNPAMAAQEMQEVQGAVQFWQIANGFAPALAQLLIDAPKTLANIKKKMRDELVVLRDEGAVNEDIEAALSGLAQQVAQTELSGRTTGQPGAPIQ